MSHELNPNHPVTMAAHDHWHKIVALLMMMREETEVEIPVSEIQKHLTDDPAEMKVVVLQDTGRSLVLRLVTLEEGQRLAREAGGLIA